MSQKPDEYLIKKVVRGESNAYAELVDRYKHMVYTLAIKIVKNPEDAEEVAQDTFIKVYSSLKYFKGDSKFSTWLYKIAYYGSLDYLKKNKRRVETTRLDISEEYNIASMDDALAGMEAKERTEIIKHAIQELPGEDAVLITLYYFEMQSMKEISKVMGLAPNTVKVRLFRGRKRLAKILENTMEQEIIDSYNRLNKLNVSRETFLDFEVFISMILEKNEKINIISQENSKNNVIRERHIIDSAQIIDFIDFNQNTTTDLGSGGGLPGIVIAIILKNMKKEMKVHLYEKSYHKSIFLKEVSRKLELNTEILQKDIFEVKKLVTGTIMSRAFKPMPVILDLAYEKFSHYTNLIFFMGKNGKKVFEDSLKSWDLEYTKKKSLTNEDSFLINVKKIRKKNKKN